MPACMYSYPHVSVCVTPLICPIYHTTIDVNNDNNYIVQKMEIHITNYIQPCNMYSNNIKYSVCR